MAWRPRGACRWLATSRRDGAGSYSAGARWRDLRCAEQSVGKAISGDAASTLADTAATIIDYTQGGIYYDAEYQDQLALRAREAGSIWIADEVVTGAGRAGRWFAFQGGESRPDIVTLGKSLGGGAAAVAAIVVSKAIVEQLRARVGRTTERCGHPISMAAISAYPCDRAKTSSPGYGSSKDCSPSVCSRSPGGIPA